MVAQKKDGLLKKYGPKKKQREKRGNHVSKKRERDRDDSREKSHYLKE